MGIGRWSQSCFNHIYSGCARVRAPSSGRYAHGGCGCIFPPSSCGKYLCPTMEIEGQCTTLWNNCGARLCVLSMSLTSELVDVAAICDSYMARAPPYLSLPLLVLPNTWVWFCVLVRASSKFSLWSLPLVVACLGIGGKSGTIHLRCMFAPSTTTTILIFVVWFLPQSIALDIGVSFCIRAICHHAFVVVVGRWGGGVLAIAPPIKHWTTLLFAHSPVI